MKKRTTERPTPARKDEPDTVTLSIDLSRDAWNQLDAIAKTSGTSADTLFRRLLANALQIYAGMIRDGATPADEKPPIVRKR